jgi:4-amino-4-deoxy-L-arabinose transferase-like glycosyltransferase
VSPTGARCTIADCSGSFTTIHEDSAEKPLAKTVNDTDAHSPLGVPAASSTPAAGDPAAELVGGKPEARRIGLGPSSIAALVTLVSIVLPLGWSGLWAPHELEVADYSRRIAVALHGAERLAVPGANNSVPTLAELGKGQLPFSSVAVGFQLFGLHDWAGRLPIALWALAGIVATYLLVSRLADRVAAAYAAIALATTPLYFLQARTMLGDGVTLGVLALATSAIGLGVFRRLQGWASGVGWLLAGLVGLLGGFAARGLLYGVAIPALGVGLAWAIWRLAGNALPARSNDVAGGLSLGLGVLALGAGMWVLLGKSPELYLEVLGASLEEASKLPTHDAVLHQLGFGLFPWSALSPFAIAAVLGRDAEPDARAALGLALTSVLVVAMAVHGLCAPYMGDVPFVGTFAIAGLIGLALRDAEKPERRTRLLALGAAALLVVFLVDLRTTPEQSLLPFALDDAAFPESFGQRARAWMKYGTIACLGLMLLALGDLVTDRELVGEPGSASRRWLAQLRASQGGKLRWVLGALALLLGVLAFAAQLAARGLNVPFARLLEGRQNLFRLAFLTVPALVLGPALALLARDAAAAFLRWLPLPRARLGLAAFAGFGLVSSLGYYPALAAQLSPRNVFEAFRHQAKPGEPLAVLGQAANVAPYYAGIEVHTPKSARAGLDFLFEAPGERRWLVFGSKDLGALNQLYRQHAAPARNLPVLDALSSEVLLASNLLLPGEVDENPLSAWLTTERPTPAHPLDVDLNGQLQVLGWSITERNGPAVDAASTGQPYDFRIYYEVLANVSGNWKTFIHIDSNRRRFNGDHDTLQGKYPFRFWQKGDFVVDVHPIEFEPQFAGGTYDVYFGLFSGDKRMPVKHGKHSDNRIAGGQLAIR